MEICYKVCDNKDCPVVCISDQLGDDWVKYKIKPWFSEGHACSRKCAALLLDLGLDQLRRNHHAVEEYMRSIVRIPKGFETPPAI